MYFSIGLGFIIIAILNIGKIVHDIFKETPNAIDNDITVTEIINNFMRNTSLEHLLFLQKLQAANKYLFVTGAILMLIGMYI